MVVKPNLVKPGDTLKGEVRRAFLVPELGAKGREFAANKPEEEGRSGPPRLNKLAGSHG